ncbi:MAG: protein-glutamate O-methyltransferase [Verrucomicrobia bacterium]|nr:protein-glutamate O-methyltransferase [Verrucomicrobiota bacterium]
MRDSEFEFIRGLVYERSRISLGPDKRELVSARLGKRLRATNAPSLGAYCELLQSPGAEEELGNLIDAISTNHTFFFREQAHFDFLRQTILPEMSARARIERWPRFHVWSAACSSGEEPYSIAMTLAGALPTWPWHIEATDISRRILARATAAIYPEEPVARLPAEVVKAHFQRGYGPQEGFYRIKPALRDRVDFHHLNLLEGEPRFTEPFQVIFCRNVMIYFDRPTQEELVQRLARRLVPGGYLLVGHSESLTHIRHGLRMVRPAIYQKPPGS